MRDQIKLLMESLHMNQKAFAQTTGINEGTLSGILNGKTKPSMQTVEAIHNRLSNISIKWLMFGEGPMYESSARTTPSDKTPETATDGNGMAPGNGLPTADAAPGAAIAAGTVGGVNPSGADANGTLSLFDVGNTSNGTRRPLSGSQTREREVIKYIDKPARKITEIRVFYDDQTWESFVPKK
ncbi:MAG: helix-turn-helix transcriptional regulator [Prevotella sp.]|nr:helix-turn-helix transcriptional regulator [Prevotella sp.]